MKTYVVAKIHEIPEGTSVAVKAGKRVIAVVNVDGQFFAINNVCSHKGASMCDGIIDKDRKVVRCPWHLWDWSLETGRLEANPKRRMPTFEIKIEGDEILLYA